MVFYRKYRPQTIEELDSKEVREALVSALSQSLEDIPHAFLFTGPKGLGKTSTARIVAKVVNCTGRVPQESQVPHVPREKKARDTRDTLDTSSIEPCNNCVQCTSITNGSNLDVMEMDGASNRGIDEIRELKETIKLTPFSSNKKVYIIDEVHMLTTEAFNALLKTLEEPPSHALFILCTTELHKVPSTVLSRCFHVAFKSATEEELVRAFKRIVKSEKLDVEDDALRRIASLSDGGFRDGTKILEEISAKGKGKKITASKVDDFYQLKGSQPLLTSLVSAFVEKDVQKGIGIVQQIRNEGIDIKYIIEELLKKVHSTILADSGVKNAQEDPHLASLSLPELVHISEILSQAYSETKYAIIPELPLELAFLEWSNMVKSDGDEKEERGQGIVMSDSGISMTSLRKHVGNMAKQKALNGEVKEAKKDPIKTSGVSILHFSADGEITKEWLNDFWSSLLERLKSEHHTTAGVLRGCKLKSFDRKNLVLQTAYKFHKERLEDAKTKAIIEKAVKELIGKPVAVTLELKS